MAIKKNIGIDYENRIFKIKYIGELLRQKGFSSAQLSKYLDGNISPALIEKYIQGKRKIVEDKQVYLDDIVLFLECTSSQEKKLRECVRFDMIGEVEYNRITKISKFIHTITNSAMGASHNYLIQDCIMEEKTVLYGMDNILTYIENNIMKYKNTKTKVCLYTHNYSKEIMDLLYRIYSINEDDVSIHHITMFDKMILGDESKKLHKIDYLANSLKIFFLNTSYNSYYQYINGNYELCDELINYILFEDKVVVFNIALENALIINDPSQVMVYKDAFKKRIKTSECICHDIGHTELIKYINSHVDSDTKILYSIPSPRHILGENDKIIESYIDMNTEEGKRFYQEYQDINELMNSRKMNLSQVYCTIQGLDYFASTGYFHEYPTQYVEPLSKNIRKQCLNRLINRMNSIKINYLDLPEFNPGSLCEIYFFRKSIVLVGLNKKRGKSVMEINEHDTLLMFSSYIENRIQFNCLTDEETKDHLQSLTQELS